MQKLVTYVSERPDPLRAGYRGATRLMGVAAVQAVKAARKVGGDVVDAAVDAAVARERQS